MVAPPTASRGANCSLQFSVISLQINLKQESLYQHGLVKVLFLPHHHHFLLFSLDLELDVHLSMDLWRKEHCSVKLFLLPPSFSSLAVEVRRTTFYTEIFGCHIHKRTEYFPKTRVEDSMSPFQGTSRRKCMYNTK